jgi:hypothetical protein
MSVKAALREGTGLDCLLHDLKIQQQAEIQFTCHTIQSFKIHNSMVDLYHDKNKSLNYFGIDFLYFILQKHSYIIDGAFSSLNIFDFL